MIVHGVNLLKELPVFQMFGHVDLKTFGVRACGLLYSLYLVDWLTLKGKGCCQQVIVTAESAGTQEI